MNTKLPPCLTTVNPNEEQVTWILKPQEVEGQYLFQQTCYTTVGIQNSLTEIEVLMLLEFLRQWAQLHQGIDYLQVFNCEDGRTVWLIDSTPPSQETGYCTLLLPSEY